MRSHAGIFHRPPQFGVLRARMAPPSAGGVLPGNCLNSCWLLCGAEANDWFMRQKRRPMPRIAADLRAPVFNVHREVVRDEGTAISGRSPVTISRMRADKAVATARLIRWTEPRGSSRSFIHPTSGITESRSIASAGGIL
jgi:hypothetical protein